MNNQEYDSFKLGDMPQQVDLKCHREIRFNGTVVQRGAVIKILSHSDQFTEDGQRLMNVRIGDSDVLLPENEVVIGDDSLGLLRRILGTRQMKMTRMIDMVYQFDE